MGPIDEQLLNKRYCFWALIIVLTLAGLSNLLLSITVITVLRVNEGMESMEVMPEEHLIKLYGRTDLDMVTLQKGVCEGYGNEPLEVTAEESGVSIGVKAHQPRDSRYDSTIFANTKVEILPNGTAISSTTSFEIKDPSTGSTYFSTDFPNFGLPVGVEKLDVKLAESDRIVSPINVSLTVSSDSKVSMHGAESANIDAKEIVLSANSQLFLKSINGSIILHANDGIYIDLANIPVAPALPLNSVTSSQYKLCICMPQGKLFRLPISKDINNRSSNCARISRTPDNDPCVR